MTLADGAVVQRFAIDVVLKPGETLSSGETLQLLTTSMEFDGGSTGGVKLRAIASSVEISDIFETAGSTRLIVEFMCRS
jgi:hypothetical protein